MNNQLRDDMATMAHYLRINAATLPLNAASAWTRIYAVLLGTQAAQVKPEDEDRRRITRKDIFDLFNIQPEGVPESYPASKTISVTAAFRQYFLSAMSQVTDDVVDAMVSGIWADICQRDDVHLGEFDDTVKTEIVAEWKLIVRRVLLTGETKCQP